MIRVLRNTNSSERKLYRYKLLGKEEIDCICDFCGKKRISISYTVEDVDTQEIYHFGSVCIKKALGVTASKIDKEMRTIRSEITERYMYKINRLQWKALAIMEEYRKANNYPFGVLPDTVTEYWGAKEEEKELKDQMQKELNHYSV